MEKALFYLPKKNIPRNEWINQECIKLGREVHRLKKKFNRINSAKNESLYKNAKKEYQKMIRREKNNYYKKKLENCKGDSHKIWQVINELLRRKSKKSSAKNDILIENGMSYSTDKKICKYLNNYYRNIAFEIEKSLDKSKNNYLHYLNKSKQSKEIFQFQTQQKMKS